jgi:ribosome-associated protein
MNKEKHTKISKNSLPQGVRVSLKASQAKKAEGIIVLDLSEISSFTDYFIIMHGYSDKQNIAICNSVARALKKVNFKPLSIEGLDKAEWVLMDYGSFIIHIFSEHAREYYSLEKLWGDGPKLDIKNEIKNIMAGENK